MSAETGGPASVPYDNAVYLNFTSMHSVQPIIARVRELAEAHLEVTRVPRLSWFRELANLDTPIDLPLREFPFSVYLISGNAGSGKSTCVQTLNETLDCVVTGATRVAAQNMYAKLSGAFLSRPINTIFYEFGFRGNHVQASLGQYPYTLASSPATLEDLQRRDLTYYWEVISDITHRALGAEAAGGDEGDAQQEFVALEAIERSLGVPRGSLASAAFAVHGSLPAFTRSNVIVIDEAGLLGRHLLTAVVYCWWLTNARYRTPQYAAGRRPVLVCVGSPTQTASLESTFEHSQLKCHVRQSENVLTYLICNRTLREYTQLSRNWAIFINNKRCVEHEFGDLMKVLEYGLPITDAHMQFVDRFVVPESYICNPANLPGWTRLFSSHKEVSAYMSRLHAHLRHSGDRQFVVFTLPALTFISLAEFEQYRQLTNQPSLSVEKWLAANASRIANYSQSQDQDAGRVRCEVHSAYQLAVARTDITYVLNSQVAVTTRLRKYVFGFCGTFRLFESVLRDDSFVKTQGETQVEYAYRFLSRLIFGGLIQFYNFLLDPRLHDDKRSEAHDRLAALTAQLLPAADTPSGSLAKPGSRDPGVGCGQGSVGSKPDASGRAFDFRGVGASEEKPTEDDFPTDDLDDVIFGGAGGKEIDMFYCYYDLNQPESTAAVHAQFALLKRAYLGRYAIMRELFGASFEDAPFGTYVDNVVFRGCEMVTCTLRGGLMSMALPTDSYTLVGHTYARVPAFVEELMRRRGASSKAGKGGGSGSQGAGVGTLLEESPMPYVVLRDQRGFASVANTNVSEFVETVEGRELAMATNADYGISTRLAMTITRSQGLSLDRVAICFAPNNIRLNSAYVAMSRTTSSEFLRMNINPLRERHERDDVISEHILAALRDPDVLIVY
ncbi:helicase-primase helicase subunit [Saimiriine alphaherpesvirus 1]|uniref:Helicase-primase helicase subunit n=1 Tax=Saimiriine herpesvirus 1 (strain MV-5-4-PSL) TaxID=10353 RepID=E2IUG5_SHV1|nr:helicase-primase helicase subunit [Saimiriine alphaherpesvirus 1]ADO13823.1 helicase-primase helicase subunit [Saimiriine alphaherpesvirus 1]